MQDPNMPRWIMASCRTWFNAHVQNGVKIFWEYTRHKDVTDKKTGQAIKRYAEFRLNGPFYTLKTSNECWYDVDINVLLTQNLTQGASDEIEDLIGSLFVCFTQSIPIYRFGPADNVINDSSQIGCLMRMNERGGEVDVSRFGQANPDTLVTQASIEAMYRLKLVN